MSRSRASNCVFRVERESSSVRHSSPLTAGIFVVSGSQTEIYRRFKVRRSFWSEIPKLASAGLEGLEECAAGCVSNTECTAYLYGTECTLAKVMVVEVVEVDQEGWWTRSWFVWFHDDVCVQSFPVSRQKTFLVVTNPWRRSIFRSRA